MINMTVVSERRVISKDVEPLPGDGYYAPIEHFFYDSTPALGDVHPLLERYRLGGAGAEKQLLTVEGFFLGRRSLDMIRAERKRLGVGRRGIQFYRFKPTHELVGLMSHRGIKPYIILNDVGETGGVGDAWLIFWSDRAGNQRIDFPREFELPDDCRRSLVLQDTNDPKQKVLILQKPANAVSANG